MKETVTRMKTRKEIDDVAKLNSVAAQIELLQDIRELLINLTHVANEEVERRMNQAHTDGGAI